jgi:hypothetical protein
MTSTETVDIIPTISPAFVHYFKGRNAVSDPYSCFVYITSDIVVGGISSFSLLSPKKGPNLTFHNDPFKRTNVGAGDYVSRKETYVGTFRINPDELVAGEHPKELNVYQWDIDIRDSTGAKIPVLTIMNMNRMFKKTLKRNIFLYSAPGITITSRISTSLIEHVDDTVQSPEVGMPIPKIPTPKLKKPAPVPAPVPVPVPYRGDLCIFVAKQLLEFAQLKKEMCPITAEEYYKGETAVMPCGHLFMRIAIEESFKKEPSKCPACRQGGRPTYV